MCRQPDWKADEVDYRIAKIILTTLQAKGLISEEEVSTLKKELLNAVQPLIGLMEEESL